MKCNHCGAPVTLEDEFCPYCGALNEPARQHIQDMKRFTSDYQATKAEVLENAKKQSISHTRIIVLVIVVVLNVILIGLLATMDDIAYMVEEHQEKNHATEYCEQLKSYEEEKDYADLNAFYRAHDLYDVESIRQYNAVANMAGYYINVENYIYYLRTSDVQSYYSQDEVIEQIATNVTNFYEEYNYRNQGFDYTKDQYAEPHLSAMEDMESNMQALLKADCNLTDEDLQGLSEISKQELIMLIGRRMEIYE